MSKIEGDIKSGESNGRRERGEVNVFDPYCKFFAYVSSAYLGKRIDFVSYGAMKMYKDQFTPYCAFGRDMESPY